MPNLTFDVYPKQDDFIHDPARFTALVGGIGSGKSRAGVIKAIVAAASRPCLGMVTAPTYPMLRDATLRTFLDLAEPLVRDFNKSEMTATLVNGSQVLFRSADNPDRLRGPNLHFWYGDEASLYDKDVWPVMIGRLRADGEAGQAWLTTTPKGRNWLYQRQADMSVTRVRTRDNPWLSAEFVRSLEASYTGLFARQELEGEFVAFEGLVYDDFDRAVHVAAPPSSFVQVVAGVDEGYTNPAVIIPVGFDTDGRAWVITEFYQRRVLQGTVVQTARMFRDLYRVRAFYVDPSAAGLAAEMQQAGLTVIAANNSVAEGIQTVKARLARAGDGKPRLFVSPECANLLAELESYVWREGRGGLRDEPVKENDHACLVAGTLIATRRGAVPIEYINVGDYVITRQGWQRVLWAGQTVSSASVITAFFSDGSRLTGTPTHPVYVEGKGYTDLRALRYGDIIETQPLQEVSLCQSAPAPQWMRWNTEALSIGAIQTLSGGPTACTTRPTAYIVSAAWDGFTKRYGKMLMELSRMIATFTTATATRLITLLIILLACLGVTTWRNMARHLPRKSGSNYGREWRKPVTRLLSGIGPRKGGHGIKRWGFCLGRTVNQLRVRVSIAVSLMKLWQVMGRTAFALISAEPPRGARVAWITRTEPVRSAERHSRPTSTATSVIAPVYVVNVQDERENADVYNLVVDVAPEFYANGILVHNCDALRYALMGDKRPGRGASTQTSYLR